MRLVAIAVMAGLGPCACSSFQLDGADAADDAAVPDGRGADGPSTFDGGSHPDVSPSDAPDERDATIPADAARDASMHDAPREAAAADAPRDARADAAGDAADVNDAGVSPLLAVPPLDAAVCDAIANITVCPHGNCLITGPGPVGRCQDCSPGECSGHNGTPCATSDDCDSVGFVCYAGACRIMCPLDGVTQCPFPETCINVGNLVEGVCTP